ncbi:RagB/SusD family nutrient uptake outer membrane protein [Pedobacter hiemivivus]|uniref:RagB/SusD family nutrient uptake outer membrane protein n=1 Tax=Pedobacter hiemivivus TaxID=2530454 RepID=A0A4R0MF91_9SPHI|nr:RagB/SusD family nutrient uptake outer membrane protein [Pedobacter hiemivivus]TCC84484.1 RagB/SusD family nutrient uptake outer membrane protein [Pedobacter hiemivivus]
MIIKRNINTYGCLIALMVLFCFSCKKMITVPDPVNTITTSKVFATDDQANSAMVGVYSQMINLGLGGGNLYSGFACGSSTMYGGSSSDEFVSYSPGPNPTSLVKVESHPLWTTTYKAIYGANDVIEGIAASTAATLKGPTRIRLTAEAKFIRAFSYFYLVNFFGDVPLVLTVDFNQTARMKRTPKAEVYAQMVKDLEDARSGLGLDFSSSKTSDRIRPNKWAATALLARVYLFIGDYQNAAAMASEVIGQSNLFQLKEDLNEVFLKNSTEAIWQLQQSDPTGTGTGTTTPEGYGFLPNFSIIGIGSFLFSDELIQDFENNDKRKIDWTLRLIKDGKMLYSPYKYKKGVNNIYDPLTEYYMVLRLAEQYLIRAEARALGAAGLGLAIDDLNVIRHRAGLDDLPATLSKAEVIAAIEKERRTELFAEWGHRWFDLKRTGRAHDVLSVLQRKQPWLGDEQFLYPIPDAEIRANNNLSQNPGY